LRAVLSLGIVVCAASACTDSSWAATCGDACAGAARQVSVGDHTVCVRYTGGAIVCWGESRGRRDDLDPALAAAGEHLSHGDERRWPERVEGLDEVMDLVCGDGYCCASHRPSWYALSCWGTMRGEAMPGIPVPEDDARVPQLVPGLFSTLTASRFVGREPERLWVEAHPSLLDVSPGAYTGEDGWWRTIGTVDGPCAWTWESWTDQGPVVCRGGNENGERGLGYLGPVRAGDEGTPAIALERARGLAVNFDERCALDWRGDVFCWGMSPTIWHQRARLSGELVEEPIPTPTRVEGLPPMRLLQASDGCFCGASEGGELYCWGVDSVGLLQTGAADGERWTPFHVPYAGSVAAFDMNDGRACVVDFFEVACTPDATPPSVDVEGHARGELVPVPGLPELYPRSSGSSGDGWFE